MRRWIPFLLVSTFLLAATVAARADTAAAQDHKSDAKAVARGRHVFNSKCAHCHGEDAAAEDSFYNLPELLSDKTDAFFFHTVTTGIASKGMPPWRGILNRRQMADVLAFIRSIEKEQGIGPD